MSEFDLLLLGQAVTTPASDASTNPWVVWIVNVLIVVALFTLPFLLGNFFAKRLRMPTIGGRIGFALFVIAATLSVCIKANWQVPLGVDIRGGTILVYEILKSSNSGDPVKADAVVTALQNRLNPSGTKEISIRPYGENQIEVVVPVIDPFEVDNIKKSIREAGQLKFRIVANQRDHGLIIQAAQKLAQSSSPTQRDVYNEEKRLVGQWFKVGRNDKPTGPDKIYRMRTPVMAYVIRNSRTGEFLNPPPLPDDELAFERWLAAQKIESVDVLMALERNEAAKYAEVSGDDLASASFTYDKAGAPAVSFNLNTVGAGKMFKLTLANQPDGNFFRQMAIILDENVLSAPRLNTAISTNGIIEGNFTREEVEFIVQILRAGKLPAALSPEPISESRIGSLLGASTIEKGAWASILSVFVTLGCLLLYYRFSGAVAALALVLNGLMIWATMILIQQPLTLPGLAGMVLTLGMAVDANVLVFERMREEKAKGSTARMAIRNGFDRAFTTIVDSNLTTLIAAVVLYWIGTDQIRGFAVALIIGILISMFTAVFCARIIFDISEKLNKLSLGMSDGIAWAKKSLLGDKDLDFMAWQKFNISISILLILIGLGALAYRGRNFLAIDFNGGTSATIQLSEPVPADELRPIMENVFDKDENGQEVEWTLQRMEQEPLNTVYKIDTSFIEVNNLKKVLAEGLRKEPKVKMVTYKVDLVPPQKVGMRNGIGRAGKLIAWQDPAAETKPADAKPDEAKPADAQAATNAEVSAKDSLDPIAKSEPVNATDKPADKPAMPGESTAPKVTSKFSVTFSKSNVDPKDAEAKVNYEALVNYLATASQAVGLNLTPAQFSATPNPIPSDWNKESVAGASSWDVELQAEPAEAEKIANQLKSSLETEPVWLSLSNIGQRVAGDMKQKAVAALLVSLIFIVAYIWFRFQKLSYGLAAVIALLHDVLITLGLVAVCHWLAGPLNFLMIEDFKMDLIMVAAFLTIIGYSLNDTIVVFDRIREVRGKSPRLTSEMVNTSVNQTLSRTLLTSSTTLLTIALLYFFGGSGIHGFSFALFIGIVVGTYSSIFIASPVLLWIASRQQAAAAVSNTRRMESRASV